MVLFWPYPSGISQESESVLAGREHWDLEGTNSLGGGRSPSLVQANEKVETKSGL